jgi:hypothetical protein
LFSGGKVDGKIFLNSERREEKEEGGRERGGRRYRLSMKPSSAVGAAR